MSVTLVRPPSAQGSERWPFAWSVWGASGVAAAASFVSLGSTLPALFSEPVCLVRSLAFIHGPFTWILDRQGRSDNEDFGKAVFALRRQNHAAHARIQRQLGKLLPELGNLTLAVDRAQLLQQLIAVANQPGAWRFNKWKVFHVTQLECSHAQDDGGQR